MWWTLASTTFHLLPRGNWEITYLNNAFLFWNATALRLGWNGGCNWVKIHSWEQVPFCKLYFGLHRKIQILVSVSIISSHFQILTSLFLRCMVSLVLSFMLGNFPLYLPSLESILFYFSAITANVQFKLCRTGSDKVPCTFPKHRSYY